MLYWGLPHIKIYSHIETDQVNWLPQNSMQIVIIAYMSFVKAKKTKFKTKRYMHSWVKVPFLGLPCDPGGELVLCRWMKGLFSGFITTIYYSWPWWSRNHWIVASSFVNVILISIALFWLALWPGEISFVELIHNFF